ncbi:MAG: 3'-5' exonuclease, partial [Chthoniobacteraceae bacterium]
GRVRVIIAPAGEGADAEDKNGALVAKALEFVCTHLAEDPRRKIGILLRKKNLMPRLIGDIRGAHPEVDVSGEGGNPLTDSRAVEVILSLLAWLDHPGSTAARYLVLTSPLAAAFGFPATVRAEDSVIADERHALRAMRHELTGRGYAATLRKWIRHPAFFAACSDHDVQRSEQLLDVAREFDARGPMRPSDFAAHVRKRRIERPGSSGVRVMTIHASKGLEFEAVLLLELDAAQGGRGDVIISGPDESPRIVPSKKDAQFLGMEELVAAQVSADFMEELSVLYVGMTRARSYLDIILREGSKAPLAVLLRRALQVDADRVVEEFDGLSMRECDEARGRGGLTIEKADPGMVRASATPARRAIPRYEGRIGHATPSDRGESGIVSATNILDPPNRTAMQRGDLVHAWLRQISWIEDGLPDAAALVSSTTDLASGLDRAEVAGWAQRLITEAQTPETDLHRSLARPAFGKGESLELWRERPFAVLRNAQGRPEVLSGAFDRVALWRDANGKALRAEIVDFKSDRFSSPEERTATEARYAAQLDAYREAL